jgi:hypothetical protein
MDDQNSTAPAVSEDAVASTDTSVSTPVVGPVSETAPDPAPTVNPAAVATNAATDDVAPAASDSSGVDSAPTQNVAVSDTTVAQVGETLGQDAKSDLSEVATDAEKDVVAPAEGVADEVLDQASTDVETAAKEDEPAVADDVKALHSKVVAALDSAVASLQADGSRELALVRTKLEEAKLWADQLLQKKPQ